MDQKYNRYLYPFLCSLLLIFNLTQAFYTHLIYDEAYYWLYSQHLAWGYFDHPPLIALFIKMGYSIFQNELGVRLIGAVSNFFILLLIPKILGIEDIKGKLTVLIICASLPLFQLLGFISTPDAPLLFFSCLYFYFLKNFYKDQNIQTATLLGFTMALMAYSKYHAFLLVFFTVLSNWRLLKNRLFIMALVIALIALVPHIFWQIKNNFISFKYHLSERHHGPELFHFPEYILNVLLIFNPLMVFFIFKSLSRANIENDFQRTLRLIIIGTLVFFLGCNFLGHVQPQWLVITMIPTIVLLYDYFKKNESKFNNLKRVFLISSGLFLFIRLVLIFDILPVQLEFHSYQSRVDGIIRKSGGLPVVFQSNYRLASVYAFQTRNKDVHSYGNKSAFNEWNNGKFYYHKQVMLVGSDLQNADTVNYGKAQVQTVSFLQSYGDHNDLSMK